MRGYTHERPDEYNVQYGVSVQRELPGATNLSIGYTGSQGYDLFQRGVSNLIDPSRCAAGPEVGQVDFKTGASTISPSPLYPRPAAAAASSTPCSSG